MRKSLAVFLAAAALAIAASAIAESAADTTLPFRLNDTGATLCVVGQPGDRSFSADCAGSGQDGEFGRDSTAPGDADGRAGFSFAKVCHSGDVAGTGVCPADPVPGSAADAWGCTLDRATGLLWEVKTDDGGLHDSRPLYTNFLPGDTRYGDANDAAGFVDAVNASALCGATDWRVPDRAELHSLVDYGVASESRAPTIDTAWFPHTPPDAHWTSSPFRGGITNGIYINFRTACTKGRRWCRSREACIPGMLHCNGRNCTHLRPQACRRSTASRVDSKSPNLHSRKSTRSTLCRPGG